MPGTIPSVIIDGAAPYGSVTLTFSSGAILIADSFNIDQPYSEATDNTVNATPNRARWTRQRITGTATLQSPSGTSGRPKPGETFSVLFDDNFGSVTFVVIDVPYSADNSETSMRKFTIGFREVISSITTVS